METRRRYDEIYQWSAQQEEEGRKRMKTAPAYGVIVGLLIAAIGFVIYQDMGLMVGLVVGLILGLAIYQSRRDSGLRMVLDAQRTLVAVDTEQNTREIAESVKGLKPA